MIMGLDVTVFPMQRCCRRRRHAHMTGKRLDQNARARSWPAGHALLTEGQELLGLCYWWRPPAVGNRTVLGRCPRHGRPRLVVRCHFLRCLVGAIGGFLLLRISPILYVSNWLCSVVVLAGCRLPYLRRSLRACRRRQERPLRSNRHAGRTHRRRDWTGASIPGMVHILGTRPACEAAFGAAPSFMARPSPWKKMRSVRHSHIWPDLSSD